MSDSWTIISFKEALSKKGWEPIITGDDALLITTNGRFGLFFISLRFSIKNKSFSVRGNIPIGITSEKENLFLKFINYRNLLLKIGNYEFDEKDQQIFYRLGIFYNKIDLNEQLVHNIVDKVVHGVQELWPILQMILEKDFSAEDVFKLKDE